MKKERKGQTGEEEEEENRICFLGFEGKKKNNRKRRFTSLHLVPALPPVGFFSTRLKQIKSKVLGKGKERKKFFPYEIFNGLEKFEERIRTK